MLLLLGLLPFVGGILLGIGNICGERLGPLHLGDLGLSGNDGGNGATFVWM